MTDFIRCRNMKRDMAEDKYLSRLGVDGRLKKRKGMHAYHESLLFSWCIGIFIWITKIGIKKGNSYRKNEEISI